MSDREPAIVIGGKRDDWPDGARTLTLQKGEQIAQQDAVVRLHTRRLR